MSIQTVLHYFLIYLFSCFHHRWDCYKVSEKNITIDEVSDAVKDGRLLEAFGAGTAAVVTPISCIEYKGQEIEIPATGEVTMKVWDQITGIQYGKIDHEWSVKI